MSFRQLLFTTTMGNRFGIHGLEAASVHSERDVDVGRISNRPIEVPVTESRSDFGSSCPDPEVSQTKFAQSYNGAQAAGQETRSVSCSPEDLQTKRVFSCHMSRRVPRRVTMAPTTPKIFGQRERWSSRHRRGIAASFVYPKTSERLK